MTHNWPLALDPTCYLINSKIPSKYATVADSESIQRNLKFGSNMINSLLGFNQQSPRRCWYVSLVSRIHGDYMVKFTLIFNMLILNLCELRSELINTRLKDCIIFEFLLKIDSLVTTSIHVIGKSISPHEHLDVIFKGLH